MYCMPTVYLALCITPANCSYNNHEHLLSIYYQPDAGLEKAMAPHSSTLAWKIPSAEEPGRLQSIGALRVGHN